MTITGVADNLSDGDQSYAIRLMADNTTSDLGYKYVDPEDVTLKNLDTEMGGYYVSSVSGDTDEMAKQASFTVRLRSQPTDNITIYVSSSDTSEGTVSPDNLSFTTTDWNADQTVTITGVADNLSDGDQSYAIRLMADNTTSDLGYKYVDPEDVTLKNLDTEKGGYYVSSVSGDTDEMAKQASFTVRLRSQPSDNITIYVASSDTSEGTVSADNLSFTTSDWNADQTVTITGVADNLSDGDQSYAIRLMADNTTSDLGYKYVDPEDVTLKNLDTEMGGYYVSSVSGDTDEMAKQASFTVRLRSQPSDNITIYVASSDTSEGTVSDG